MQMEFPTMAQNRPTAGRVVLQEEVVGEAPVVVRRWVKWGEIDFARVAYTGKFLDYVLEAAEVWFKVVTGEHWAHFDLRHDMSVPVVGCNLDFHVALHPDDRLDLTVTLERIGRSSHGVAVNGHNQHGVLCFESALTFACIDPATERSVAMPDNFRRQLEAYKKACAGG